MIFNGKRLVLDEQHFLLCLPGKFLGLPPESAPDSIWAHLRSELRSVDTEYPEKNLDQTTEDDFDGIGWRPILIPLTPQDSFDPEVFGHFPNGTRAKMYTVIMGGRTVRADIDDPELYMVGSSIALTDRFHSNNTLVGWVICDGIAIADRNLLGDISWNSLRDQGLFEDKVDIVIEPMSQLSICHALIRYRKEDGAEYALHQPLSKS